MQKIASFLIGLTVAGLVQQTDLRAAVSDEVQALLEDAGDYLAQDNFAAAIIQMKNAVRAAPDRGDLRRQLGEVYLQAGQPRNAEKEFRAALDKGEAPELLQLPLARALFAQRKFLQLLSETQLDPDLEADAFVDLMALHTGSMYETGQYEETVTQAEKLLKLAPGHLRGHELLIGGLMDQGERDKAAEILAGLSGELGGKAGILYLQGELRRLNNDWDAADEWYRKALTADAGFFPAMLRHSIYLVSTDRFDEASEVVRVFEQRSPGGLPSRYLRALIAYKQGNVAAANNMLAAMGDNIRRYTPALLLASAVRLELNDTEQAQKLAEEYLALVPASPQAIAVLGAVHIRRGEILKAIAQLEGAMESLPEDLGILGALGEAYMLAGRMDQAAEIFEKAQQLDPDNPDFKTNAAISQFRSGQRAEALAGLERLLSGEGGDNRSLFALLQGKVRDRNFTEAHALVDHRIDQVAGDPMLPFLKAGLYEAEDNLTAAQDILERMAIQYPDFLPARLRLAMFAVADGRVGEAQENLQALLDRWPGNGDILLTLARISEIRADDRQAEHWFREAIEHSAGEVVLRRELVEMLIRSGRLDDAEREARALVLQHPGAALSREALVQVLMEKGQPGAAAVEMRSVVRINPNDARMQLQLGRVLNAARDPYGARAALERAVALEPGFEEARLALAELVLEMDGVNAALDIVSSGSLLRGATAVKVQKADYLVRRGRLEEAAELYREVLKTESEPGLVAKYFNTLLFLGDGGSAFRWLGNWVENHPNDAESRMLYAHGLLSVGEYARAVEQYLVLTESIPDNAVPWNNLGWIMDQTGDSKAMDYALKAYELAPKSVLVADTYGWLLLKGGRTAEGMEILQRVVVTAPHNPELGYHYAVGLVTEGRRDEGLRYLRKAVNSKTDFAEKDNARQFLESLEKN